MWLKVVLLLVYLCMLFIFARLNEALVWFEKGHQSYRLLDPMSLSVSNLKAILEQRGVNYNSLVEKSELTELVEATGAVTEEDQEASLMLQVDDSTTLITNFSGGTDFYEQVEDEKDSIWLVEVMTNSHQQHLLSDAIWRAVKRKVDKFGVRLGRFDCSKDTRYCKERKWISSMLVLALPGTYQSKANMARYIYQGSIQTESIVNWVRQKLDLKIYSIKNYEMYKTDWLTYNTAFNPEVRAIFFSSMTTIPMVFSALSVKFPGRVKMGYVNTKTRQGNYWVQKDSNLNVTSTYVFITADSTFYYGYNPGEILNFHCLEFFLKTLYPNQNDMFVISIMVVNCLGFFKISLTQGGIISKIICLLLCIVKYNVTLILFWIIFLGIYKLPLVENFVLLSIRAMRYITGSYVFSFIRKDICLYSIHWPLLFLSYFAYMILTSFLCKKMCYIQSSDDEHDWWKFSSLQTAGHIQPSHAEHEYLDWRNINSLQTAGHGHIQPSHAEHEYLDWRNINSLRTEEYGNIRSSDTAHENSNEVNFSSSLTTHHGYTQPSDAEQEDSERRTEYENFQPLDADLDFRTIYSLRTAEYGYIRPADSEHENPDQLNISSLRTADYGEIRQDYNSLHPFDFIFNLTMLLSSTQVGNSLDLEEPIIPNDYIRQLKTWRYSTNLRHQGDDLIHSSVSEDSFDETNNQPKSFPDYGQCVICQDSFEAGDQMLGLPCFHSFHEKCILPWLLQNKHFCPICRRPSYKQKCHDAPNALHIE